MRNTVYQDYFVHMSQGLEGPKLIHVVGGPCDHLRVEPNYHSLGLCHNCEEAQTKAISWNHFANCCPKCCGGIVHSA